jgi:Restriction endonuclease
VKSKIAETRYLIECKRYAEARKVGIAPVRSLYAVKTHERATKALLATTSTFTRDATDFWRQHRWELELKDYTGVLDWAKLASAPSTSEVDYG